MIEWLAEADKVLFLALNAAGSPLLDQPMVWLSDKYIWIPLYGFLVFTLVKRYKAKFYISLTAIVLVITLCDQFTSSFMKPFFERPRPCHEPLLEGLVVMAKGCGGAFGFASSHAANSFGLAFFFHFLFKNKYSQVLLGWAFLVSYSRVYLGVHYPGDVLVGGVVGWMMAFAVFNIIQKTKPMGVPGQ